MGPSENVDGAVAVGPAGVARPPPDLVCAACGYPLGGIPDDSRCPECGLSVGASRRGHLLRVADADWRSTLRTGAAFVAIAPAIAAGFVILVMLWSGLGILLGADSAASGAPTWVFSLAMMIASGLLARGWWLMTLDEPDAPVSTSTHALGWVLRFSSIGLLATVTLLWIIGNALEWLGGTGHLVEAASIVPLGLLGLTHVVAAMVFISRLAARIPSPKMAREFRRSAWLVAVAGVLEGIHLSTGWRPTPPPARGVGALLSLGVTLVNLLTSLALLAAPFWYAYSGLWLWRRLRGIDRALPGAATHDESEQSP